MRVTIITLALLGIVVSGYSWYLHESETTETFCDISATFSCSIVNKSVYSEFANVPVAAIGFFGYIFLLLLASQKQIPWRYLFAAGLLGVVFSLYLTWVEYAVLKAWCLFCLISQADIFTVALLAGMQYARRASRE
ncbi:MAG: vitamin K epoxide reductase family protein [Patescibacteria group bacterium]